MTHKLADDYLLIERLLELKKARAQIWTNKWSTLGRGRSLSPLGCPPSELKKRGDEVITLIKCISHQGNTSDVLRLMRTNAELIIENAALKQEVAAMKSQCVENVLEIREIPREQAKEEIRAFFKENHGGAIYPSDIMEALSLDYDLIYEICEELEREGIVKGL